MLLKTAVVSALFAICLGYAAYPCLTLFQLQDAIRSGDASRMARLVDWTSVRDGLDEEIAADAEQVSNSRAISDGTQLAPFGFGFVRGVASHALETRVTAPAVLHAFHGDAGGSGLRPCAAWFDSPTRFVVRLVDGTGDKLRVRLDLSDGRWRACAPCLADHGISQRIVGRFVRDRHQANFRIIGSRDFSLLVVHSAIYSLRHGKFHVGLTGCNPDIPDQYILQGDRVAAVYLHRKRTAGFSRS